MDWAEKVRLEGIRMAHDNLDLAVKDVISTLEQQYAVGKVGDENLSAYSDRHAKRRNEIGLSTSPKDLFYSGTMIGSLTEIERVEDSEGVTAKVSFHGTPYRRPDQKRSHSSEPKTTRDQADLLSKQQREGKSIMKLSVFKRNEIQTKRGVQIDD